MNLDLADFGWNPSWEFHLDSLNDPRLKPARVVRADRTAYDVAAASERVHARVSGAFRNTVTRVSGFPVVGDWVALGSVDADHRIEAVLPRTTAFVPAKERRYDLVASTVPSPESGRQIGR